MLQRYIQPGDSLIAFLPLAHCLEFVIEHICIFAGVPLGYGNRQTLTNTSVRNCLGDICELRPTVLTGVPIVYELIRKGIMMKKKKSFSFRMR